MARSKLIGMPIDLRLGEPWELVSELATSIHPSAIVGHGLKPGSTSVEYLTIKLDTPFQHDGVDYEYFIATPYHGDLTFRVLLLWFGFECSLERVSKEQAVSGNPFEGNWKPKGINYIATTELNRNSI